MEKLFLPYEGTHPATFTVNGHKLVFVTRDADLLEEFIANYGGDSVHAVGNEEFSSEDDLVRELESTADAKVVLSPPDAKLEDVMNTLREVLPWVQ